MGPSDVTSDQRLGQAISGYLSTLPASEREAVGRELGRFARWLGADIPIGRITPRDVSRYQEQFPESSVDLHGRLGPVKVFLTGLRDRRLTSINLGAHIRLPRLSRKQRSAEARRAEPEAVRITELGFAQLTRELERLEKEVRPQVTEELGQAYLDRDFRENAPYDAAKEKLAEVQSRIEEIRRTLGSASIYTGDSTERVDLGTVVTLHSLQENEKVVYTIVGPGEVSPREGKISIQSPVGRALVSRCVGEVVEVQTPAGVETFRIERIGRSR